MQEVQLDSKIKLLDCPGIVLPGGDTSDAAAALRNAVKIENLDDPITPVDAILQRADKKQVCVFEYRGWSLVLGGKLNWESDFRQQSSFS